MEQCKVLRKGGYSSTRELRGEDSALERQLDNYRELIYNCRFRETIDSIDAISDMPQSSLFLVEHHSIKASAYLELGEVSKAKEVLARYVSQKDSEVSPGYFYMIARLRYLEGDTNEALEAFYEAIEYAESERILFLSLMGLGNALVSLGKSIEPVIDDLSDMVDDQRVDSQIAFKMLVATFEHNIEGNLERAYTLYQEALALATKAGWNYFISRIIFALARIYKDQNATDKLEWTLEFLTFFVDPNESVYLAKLIDEHFNGVTPSVQPSIQFISHEGILIIGNQRFPLHNSPKVFTFFKLLYGRVDFISKKDLAEEIWQDDNYQSYMHDARIFDLARRARIILDSVEGTPWTLLSGRMGYRIAKSNEI